MNDTVLAVDKLRVALDDGTPIVQDVSLSVRRGEVLGLVGESGSGKTTLALALLGYTRPGVRIESGLVTVSGQKITGRTERDVRPLRGSVVAYVPQDPQAALNPTFRIGALIGELLRSGRPACPVEDVLRRVHLPTDHAFQRRYPHQLSGGQQQRVVIAAALAGEPPLVVLDEPTTGLDVVTQAHVLEEIRRLRQQTGATMVYVSHDLAVISSIATRVAVMYAGQIVEEGAGSEILGAPCHPYTRGLVSSIPDHLSPRRLHGIEGVAPAPGEHSAGCPFAPRCMLRADRCEEQAPPREAVSETRSVRCFRWRDRTPVQIDGLMGTAAHTDPEPLLSVGALTASYRSAQGPSTVVAHDVSFVIVRGECVALVGESGSGKTTIARCIAGLHAPDRGRLLFGGETLARRAQKRTVAQRRQIQIVFQNPYESLNPRHRVGDAIARPAILLRKLSHREGEREAARLLDRVRLPARLASKYPGELSGGERQRVAIARALAAEPELVVCDEVTSALDVSVQAAVIELLSSLRQDLGVAILFISHDLGVVASIADRALVLELGHVREAGAVQDLLLRPAHPYTKALVAAAPRLVTGHPADRPARTGVGSGQVEPARAEAIDGSQ